MYDIPVQNTAQFENKLDRLAKRATKLGLRGPSYQQVGEHYQSYKGRQLRIAEYEVDFGEPVVLKGWWFVCAIEHTENGNVIKGGQEVSALWRTVEPKCEHCNQNRKRNKTYALVNGYGDYIQVGSTCLKDFTGHADAEAIADYFTGISEFEGSEIREMEYDPDKAYDASHINVRKYLEFVAMSVRKNGYISRRKADFELGGLSTADDALFEMTGGKESPNSADSEIAEKVVGFATALDPKNDFEHNIKVLATSETAHHHNVGYIAGAFYAYIRDEETKTENAASEYVGEVKERRVFTLTMVMGKTMPDMGYGCSTLYKFVDENGNVFIWFSSKEQGLYKGETYEIKATVKAHKEFNHEKQTVITRGKVQ